MKKHRGTTNRKYDYDISPQNEPYIHLKRLLHFLSCFWFVINCIVLAKLLPDQHKMPLIGLAFVIIVYALIQQIDQRRGNWTWFGIIFWTIASFVMPIMEISEFDLYWYLIVLTAQILISIMICFIFKKKH